ncbi:DUF1648 domain-containing protein [Chryseobacterium paludis]|uniref:DUF1648 domain-containing protein n=1 Tax=Chryseobacterium paludis TaxID=2956784 RepID=UPI0021BFF428|nr:DUF1648 domain-containing protein [Chryseobacterium paludis]
MISKCLLIVSIILLISIWVFTGMKYAGLPDIIPTHFDAQGNINGYDHKKMIWVAPSISTFVFLILVGVTRNPNSPMVHVPDGFRNKKSIQIFAYSILIPFLLLMGDTVVESVWVAEEKIRTLSNMIFVFLGLLFIALGFNIFIMLKKSRNEKLER